MRRSTRLFFTAGPATQLRPAQGDQVGGPGYRLYERSRFLMSPTTGLNRAVDKWWREPPAWDEARRGGGLRPGPGHQPEGAVGVFDGPAPQPRGAGGVFDGRGPVPGRAVETLESPGQ